MKLSKRADGWSLYRIKTAKMFEVQERKHEQNLREGIKAIESIYGNKVPKGVCICETECGWAVVPTRDADPVEVADLNYAIAHKSPYRRDNVGNMEQLRSKCTGNYKKF